MRCHQHLDAEAVAVCVSCGRGVCRGCQQPTLDQRTLCGLPQCDDFARRQAAVQVVIRQDCSNRATHYQMLGALLRAISLVILVPSILFAVSLVVWIGLHPFTATLDSFLLVMLGAMLIVLATLMWRFQSRMTLLQRNWEDLSSEFGRSDNGGYGQSDSGQVGKLPHDAWL